MKKIILIAIISLSLAAGVYAAAFDGLTSIGVNYEYRDGMYLGGLSSQTFGYVNDYPVGYFVSVNADFNLGDDTLSIGMLVGPSFRYMFSNVPMSIELAVGASLAGQAFWESLFELGIGSYIGATYYINDTIALLIGCNIGYDMLGVDLNTAAAVFSGDFYVSPSLSVGFRY